MNISIQMFPKDNEQNTVNISTSEAKTKQSKKQTKSLYAGNLNLANDPIEQRKKQAQKQAMDIVKKAWTNEQDIDANVQSRKDYYQEQQKLKAEATEELKSIEQKKQELQENGIDGEELKERTAEFAKREKMLREQVRDAESAMKDAVSDVKSIKLERLKSNPMGEATGQAEQIMEAASDEIVGMIIQDTKENIAEKMAETQEKADAKKEEEEVKEEQLEKRQEEQAIQEALVAGTKEAIEKAEASIKEHQADDMDVDELLTDVVDVTKTSATSQQLEALKDSMKLLEADLKGIQVDEEA